eukprot:TRINITY_DN66436_c0_g1_i1.p2 TRINITY_DN66436_c0_g1~~TRINITY_DN66436_c0_g1_i1.p2  ORF type:complete len:233 (+),score=92.36 TRINITY_DN66436_c0_g1_i1:78-776(+)
MALIPATHCASPRVPEWQLTAWPERDPDCQECQGNHATNLHVHDAERIEQNHGSPLPANREAATLQRDNKRMMYLLAERNQADPLMIANNPCEMLKERRQAFKLFMSLQKGGEWLYGFDLNQALEALRLFIDDQQHALLLRKFNLLPGDLISFDNFSAMCDIIEAGGIPADTGSPPREQSPPVPGSPQYQAGKKEKPPPPTYPPKNPVPWHKVMDGKVKVPQHVRVRHGLHK